MCRKHPSRNNETPSHTPKKKLPKGEKYHFYTDSLFLLCTNGDLKKQLAEDIVNFTSPIRERILAYAADTEYMDKVAREGAEKARASADKTIREVRKIIGFN